METATKIIIHYLAIYCYIKLIWVVLQWAKLWLQYTNTPEGYKEAKREFKAHCKAKERLKHDDNWGIKLDL